MDSPHKGLVTLEAMTYNTLSTGGFPSQRVSNAGSNDIQYPVNWWIPLTKGPLCGALLFTSFIAWTNSWNSPSAADLRWRDYNVSRHNSKYRSTHNNYCSKEKVIRVEKCFFHNIYSCKFEFSLVLGNHIFNPTLSIELMHSTEFPILHMDH